MMAGASPGRTQQLLDRSLRRRNKTGGELNDVKLMGPCIITLFLHYKFLVRSDILITLTIRKSKNESRF